MGRPRVATTDELRRAALAGAARRGAEVARRRVRQRWAAWALRVALAALLPVLLLTGAPGGQGPAVPWSAPNESAKETPP
ncbi:MAG: hypothetical protein HY856_12345 [Burkholderiales bacterium]|nr:hypothetical protein [Burkholderiales bacterium]